MIKADLFRRYAKSLDTNSAMALDELSQFLDAFEGYENEIVRDGMLDIFPQLVNKYGDRAAEVAIEFYQSQREDAGVKGRYTPDIVEEADYEVLTEDVRRVAGPLFKGDYSAFRDGLLTMLEKRVYEQADSQLISAAMGDSHRPEACLVPNALACGWCVLIAANGWDLSYQAIEHMRHDRCRCHIAVDWDNPSLEGYDPDDAYRIYRDVDTEENRSLWYDEWLSMSDEERAKYGGWSKYRRNRTIQAMNKSMDYTRLYEDDIEALLREVKRFDAEMKDAYRTFKVDHDYSAHIRMLLDGYSEKGPITAQYRAFPQGKEIQVARWLSKKGHDIEFLYAAGEQGHHYPDMRIDGEIWELKRIETGNPTKLKSRLSDAADQSSHIILDLSINKNDIETLINAGLEMLDDERVKELFVIANGRARLYR